MRVSVYFDPGNNKYGVQIDAIQEGIAPLRIPSLVFDSQEQARQALFEFVTKYGHPPADGIPTLEEPA